MASASLFFPESLDELELLELLEELELELDLLELEWNRQSYSGLLYKYTCQ